MTKLSFIYNSHLFLQGEALPPRAISGIRIGIKEYKLCMNADDALFSFVFHHSCLLVLEDLGMILELQIIFYKSEILFSYVEKNLQKLIKINFGFISTSNFILPYI